MNLSNLLSQKTKSKKRIGRGHGSGRGGHTSTRGAKGQKARGSISLIFEGTKLKKSWIKRLPLLRGKGKFKSQQNKTAILSLNDLSCFASGDKVDISALIEKKLLKKGFDSRFSVKILGDGEIKIPLTVSLPCSAKAAKKIEKAGGKII
jgi:large subunit ribosomal protein L15